MLKAPFPRDVIFGLFPDISGLPVIVSVFGSTSPKYHDEPAPSSNTFATPKLSEPVDSTCACGPGVCGCCPDVVV
ncbi:MAG: hypothetical protein WCC17_24275 [Candidatus Nitrosopolaris sp.]